MSRVEWEGFLRKLKKYSGMALRACNAGLGQLLRLARSGEPHARFPEIPSTSVAVQDQEYKTRSKSRTDPWLIRYAAEGEEEKVEEVEWIFVGGAHQPQRHSSNQHSSKQASTVFSAPAQPRH
jgi:hypothetical protein